MASSRPWVNQNHQQADAVYAVRIETTHLIGLMETASPGVFWICAVHEHVCHVVHSHGPIRAARSSSSWKAILLRLVSIFRRRSISLSRAESSFAQDRLVLRARSFGGRVRVERCSSVQVSLGGRRWCATSQPVLWGVRNGSRSLWLKRLRSTPGHRE